jgi:phosphatidylglycerophosphate synthase
MNTPTAKSGIKSIQWANVVTLFRIFLGFVVYGLLCLKPLTNSLLYTCFILTLIVISCDYLDGKLARSLNQASAIGAWLDIAADRLIEICYWIVFAYLHWISPWVSIIFVARGLFVDGIRAVASAEGFTAFGEKTMMKSNLGKFLVASRFSRGAYGICKMLAFCLVILAQAHSQISGVAIFCTYAATIMCLIRGLPVMIEGASFLRLKSSE